MKNINFYLLVLLIVFMASSCKKDYDIETYNLGAEFIIYDNGLTSLDPDFTLTIDNVSKNLSEVTMVDYGSIAIDAEGKGTKTFIADDLGLLAPDSSVSFTFDATFDGKTFSRYSSITVENPTSLTSPYIWEKNDDDELEEVAVTVYQNSDMQYIKYSVSPERATVDAIKIETKVGEAGTYVEVAGTFVPSFDSLPVVGDGYNAGDEVFYQFTATSGLKTQVDELSFMINTVTFPHHGGSSVYVDQGFDLVASEIVGTGTDTTDLAMVHVVLTSVGFESTNGTMFVTTTADLYNNNDVVETKAAYAAGAPVAGVASIAEGDYFIYKTTRGSDEHYGVIKITGVYLTPDGSGDYFDFEYIY